MNAADQKAGAEPANQLQRDHIHFMYNRHMRIYQKAADRHQRLANLYTILDHGSYVAMFAGVYLLFAAASKNLEMSQSLAGSGLVFGASWFRSITAPSQKATEYKNVSGKCSRYSMHANRSFIRRVAYDVTKSVAELDSEQNAAMNNAVESGIVSSNDFENEMGADS